MIRISILIPTYREEKYIAGCLDSLLANYFDFAATESEILVIDGGSEDDTREIVRAYSRTHAFIKLLDNPGKVQVKALNIGLEVAQGEIIFRCDAHCVYPSNYISEILAYHAAHDAGNVGACWQTCAGAESPEARAISFVMNCKLGMGASYRTMSSDRALEVDTVPFGSWKRDLLREVGAFDEAFIRAQDLEHNVRLRGAGKKVVLLPWLKVRYFARDTLAKVAHELFQKGYWKVKVNTAHRMLSSKRQLVPVLFVIANILALPLLPFSSLIFWLFLAYNGAYLALVLSYAVRETVAQRDLALFPYLLCGFVIVHHSYAIGYLKGILDLIVMNRNGIGRILTEVTR